MTRQSVRTTRRNDLLVLCYHGVSDEWVSQLTVRTDALEKQLGFLVERGYRSVTFSELATERPSGRVVAITFDDGYRSVLEQGLPILERMGMTATVFVPTDFIESGTVASWPGMEPWLGGPQERHLRLLSWEGVRVLAAAGWEIGSHSRSHRRLRDLEDAELDSELAGSKLVVEERVQQPCRSLAYPYGSPGTDFDLRAARAAEAAGYTAAATIPRRLWPYEPLLWPRVTIGGADSQTTFRAKVSPRARRLRATRVWPVIDAPRRISRDWALSAVDSQRLRRVQNRNADAGS